MICVDASVIIPWLAHGVEPQVKQLDGALNGNEAFIAPVTITELLSDRTGAAAFADRIVVFQVLELRTGYWERAGLLRAALRGAGRKAPMADALIAQGCLDADIPLLTRDADFKPYANMFGLKLA